MNTSESQPSTNHNIEGLYNSQTQAYGDKVLNFLMKFHGAQWLDMIKSIPNVEHANILDAGCGNGDLTRIIRDQTDGRVCGVDLSASMLEKGSESSNSCSLPITFAKVDLTADDICETLRIEPEYFDIATSTWVLLHAENVESLKKMVANIARALRQGGRFVGMTMNPKMGPELSKKLLKYGEKYWVDETKNPSDGDLIPYSKLDDNGVELFRIPCFYYSLETYRKAFEEAGFTEFTVNDWIPIGEEFYKDFQDPIYFVAKK